MGGGEMCYCGEEKEERHGRTREDGGGVWKPLRQSFLAEQWSLCACVCV